MEDCERYKFHNNPVFLLVSSAGYWFECLIPPGPHRVMLDNDGPDWAVVDWLEFSP